MTFCGIVNISGTYMVFLLPLVLVAHNHITELSIDEPAGTAAVGLEGGGWWEEEEERQRITRWR